MARRQVVKLGWKLFTTAPICLPADLPTCRPAHLPACLTACVPAPPQRFLLLSLFRR
jgi:hypothetical protein